MDKIAPVHEGSLMSFIKEMYLLPVLLVMGLLSVRESGTVNDPPVIAAPVLTTNSANIITEYTVRLGRNQSSDASALLTTQVNCRSISAGHTTSDPKTSDFTGVDNNTVYGKRYNWYATADSRYMDQKGWHVASGSQRETLIINLPGGLDDAVGAKRQIRLMHWAMDNSGATGNRGLTGLSARS